MNEIQKGVVTLIKSAIDEKAYPLPEGFFIDEAFDFIMKHNIYMLAYDGAVRCGIDKNIPVMQKLFRLYINGMMLSEKQLAEVSKICSAFNENGIDHLPLKGCNMKKLYPKPELRLMGDADILIRTEQYKKLKKILEEKGFREEDEVSHHYVWNSEGLHLELHTKPMPESYKRFSDYYGNGWEKAIKTDTNRYICSPEDTFIFVITHFAKHYLEGGIGLRHIADIFVYLKAFPGMDFEYIYAELEKMGINRFCGNVIKTSDYFFNDGKTDEGVDTVSEYILRSGNWGSSESHIFAEGARNSGKSGKVKGSKLRFMFNIAFPSAGIIEGNYPVLKKAPFLLPVIWPVRWIDIILFKSKKITEKVEKIKRMDDEKSEVYREYFEKSGFDL